MRIFLIFIFICFVFDSYVEGQCNVEGYYWRDYTGEAPSDALPGGTDINGKPIYIGQILWSEFLIPAKIYSNDPKAYYEYGGSENGVTQNIKILCTQHPDDFQWAKTNNAEIKLLTEKNLVLGGYEPGCTTFIGRVRSGGEILVGKVLADNLPLNAGLYVTKDGKGIRHTSFEVLTYNPVYGRL